MMKNFESRIKQLEMLIRGTNNQVFVFDFTTNPATLSYGKEAVKIKSIDKELINDDTLNEILIKMGLIRRGQKKMIITIKDIG
jgi:hypothetical protein